MYQVIYTLNGTLDSIHVSANNTDEATERAHEMIMARYGYCTYSSYQWVGTRKI